MDNQALIHTIERMIAWGKLEGLQEKLDMFLLGGRISPETYDRLSGLVQEKRT